MEHRQPDARRAPGTFRAASFMNIGDGKGVIETVEEDGRAGPRDPADQRGRDQHRHLGCQPGRMCWLGDEGVDEMPAEIADARARWAVGKQERYLAASRPKPQAKGKPPANVMASVDRCLALAEEGAGA